jgi:asparagine synthase (glutamine-hydrolysing)
MMGLLSHRGPDAQGTHNSQYGTLGHKRLSIMGPDCGDQPIYNENGTTVMVANGEIYNHPDLMQKLREEHQYKTTSDTETAVHLYEDVGEASVYSLDGMFALAIAEGEDIFLARDPIGIKPLYYGWRNGSLIFASELKALA